MVVEGSQVGWGASGRNGGQIVNGLNASLATIERRYGSQTASFVGGLVQEGARIIYDWSTATRSTAISVAATSMPPIPPST